MTPFVLLIGLGAHAVFEGLALGLRDKMQDVEIMCLAIILHKGAAGMSLGISMAKVFPDR
jgi:zinc transporter 1/2/3